MSVIAYDALQVGQSIPDLVKGPLSTAHIMRWSAASENWHRIHYDWRYATQHDKLPDVVVNGSFKQHLIIQLLNNWVGDAGWVWKVRFQFRGMNIPGEVLTAWGKVASIHPAGDFGVVKLEIGLRNQSDVEGTPGEASVVLPRAGGPAVPYPFDPAIAQAALQE